MIACSVVLMTVSSLAVGRDAAQVQSRVMEATETSAAESAGGGGMEERAPESVLLAVKPVVSWRSGVGMPVNWVRADGFEDAGFGTGLVPGISVAPPRNA